MTSPQRLHHTDLAEIWLGDARDVLPQYATESIDLIVTDPPYGVGWQSNQRAEKFDKLIGDGAADRDAVREVIRNCVRLVGQDRHLYVFGPTDVLDGQKVSEVVSLIWDKGMHGSGNLTSPWAPAHEPINFCTSKHRHAGQAGKSVLPTRLRKGSVLRHTRPTGRKVRHPSEKPLTLLRELIESSSRAGELVLDPFSGSGSTGAAAILAGRRTLLIEKDPQWAALTVERIIAAERLAREAAGI